VINVWEPPQPLADADISAEAGDAASGEKADGNARVVVDFNQDQNSE
jgi:hypothetical protein